MVRERRQLIALRLLPAVLGASPSRSGTPMAEPTLHPGFADKHVVRTLLQCRIGPGTDGQELRELPGAENRNGDDYTPGERRPTSSVSSRDQRREAAEGRHTQKKNELGQGSQPQE
jgi:hypothetical protein